MPKHIAQQPITEPNTTQTPFEQFKAAASQVMTTPKSSLPKSQKKSRKK